MILDLIRQSRMRPMTMGGSSPSLGSTATFGHEARSAVHPRPGSRSEAKETEQQSQINPQGSWSYLTSWLKGPKR